MIRKQKKLSCDVHHFLAATLLIPLAGFFIYAAKVQISFFSILALLQIIIVVVLLIFRRRLLQKESDINLKKEEVLERANLLKAEINKKGIALDSFREEIEDYSHLKNITEKLGGSLSLNDTTKTLSQGVSQIFKHRDSTVILYLFQSKTGDLGLTSSQKGQMHVNIKMKKGDIFDQFVVRTMQPLLIEDTKTDFRFDLEKIKGEDSRPIRSLISVPLLVGNKTLGILRVDSLLERHFKTDDLRLLMTIGDLGGIAVENAQLYDKVEDLAIKDSLTGLYLRRYLMDRIPQEMTRQLRRGKGLSFMMIDLDKFKQYNDKFGHMAGDIVLRTIGMILSEFFKETGDLVCRYGGEEFSVLLPDCSKKKAVELAEEIRTKIEMHTIILRREKTRMTVSIGVATFPDDARLKDDLIHKADHALYKAKQKGRNRVCAA